jgi:hypothetical protein
MRWTTVKNLLKLIALIASNNYYWNYQLLNKNNHSMSDYGSVKSHTTEVFAIVLQGPLLEEDDFTIETIKLYRKLFPLAIIILSTWHINKNRQAILSNLDVNYIENALPENPGIANINMQIQTTKSGLLLAKKLGAQFAIKTRTDQRIYHPSLYVYLLNLLNAYPLTEKSDVQKERLIGVSLGTFKFRMYGLSDMFLFGLIDDMLLYWNIPFDRRIDTIEERRNSGKTWREFATWRVCETYLCTEFLHKIGFKTKFTLEDSFNAFKKYFIVIDSQAIKLFWNKYTFNSDRYASFGMFDPQISFNDWLIIFNNPNNFDIDYSLIDQPINPAK